MHIKRRNRLGEKQSSSSVFQSDPVWQELQTRLSNATSVIDLGCGATPHSRASVGVDAYTQPLHRTFGYGSQIQATTFKERQHFLFAQSHLESLPFRNKEFDFAYSHHVFEHLSDPKAACAEVCRIAKQGAIITPSVFAEFAFGRPYHLWLILPRGNTLIFARKLASENQPFGQHPIITATGKFKAVTDTNPFDILLNDGKWYSGREKMSRLSKLLQQYYYTHSSITEVVFLWKESFDCIVVKEDGSIT